MTLKDRVDSRPNDIYTDISEGLNKLNLEKAQIINSVASLLPHGTHLSELYFAQTTQGPGSKLLSINCSSYLKTDGKPLPSEYRYQHIDSQMLIHNGYQIQVELTDGPLIRQLNRGLYVRLPTIGR